MVDDLYWGPLRVGDWATWLAGAATFLAVCAAISVPWIQSRQLRKERLKREERAAQILAIELAELFIRLRLDMIGKRPMIQGALEGKLDGAPAAFANNVTLWGSEDLPRGADLDGLPYPIAPSIASLRTMLSMYNGSVQRALALVANYTLHESVGMTRLPDMLDSSQAALARAANHLKRFEPSYGLVDYFDKGDGTSVSRLEDYGDIE